MAEDSPEGDVTRTQPPPLDAPTSRWVDQRMVSHAAGQTVEPPPRYESPAPSRPTTWSRLMLDRPYLHRIQPRWDGQHTDVHFELAAVGHEGPGREYPTPVGPDRRAPDPAWWLQQGDVDRHLMVEV